MNNNQAPQPNATPTARGRWLRPSHRLLAVGLATAVLSGGLVPIISPADAQTTACGPAPAGMNVIESSATAIRGTTGDDFICASGADNAILGLAGNDIIYSLGGDDIVRGGVGNDIIYAGSGDDRVFGGPGRDGLRGGNGNDLILGGYHADALIGGNGWDVLSGQSGNDRLVGGNGNDYLFSGNDNDTGLGGNGNDIIWGGNGNDCLDGGDGTNYINYGTGTDTCPTPTTPTTTTTTAAPITTTTAAPTTTTAAPITTTTMAPTTTTTTPAFTWSAITDPTQIPLGNGKFSTSPENDSLFACSTTFNGREPNDGPWIDYANNTWDSTAKIKVQGSVSWPQAAYQESATGNSTRLIEFTNLPVDHPTGSFPIADSDPASTYDRNPNGIGANKMLEFEVPIFPTVAASSSCVSLGPIGVFKSGAYFYNALDTAGGDAVAHEVQDSCDGHPDGAEAYHYHAVPSCILDNVTGEGSTLVGYAIDGFGIYVERDSLGNLPTNADLDACHGRTSVVEFNGVEQNIYHYSATLEYPYTVGCYRGTPVATPPRR